MVMGSILNAMNSNHSNQTKLQKVASVRVFEQAVEQIRKQIYSAAWSTGQKLPTEKDLGTQLNVG